MFAFTVTIKPHLESYEKVKQEIISVASKAKNELGCHTYNVHEIVETDGSKNILVYEIYNSKEDFDTHMAQNYTKDLLKYFENSFLITPVVIQRFETSLL